MAKAIMIPTPMPMPTTFRIGVTIWLAMLDTVNDLGPEPKNPLGDGMAISSTQAA